MHNTINRPLLHKYKKEVFSFCSVMLLEFYKKKYFEKKLIFKFLKRTSNQIKNNGKKMLHCRYIKATFASAFETLVRSS